MSRTEIYAVTKTSCREIGRTKNSFRSAMYIWQDMARRYHGMSAFPHFDEGQKSKVWNTQNYYDMPEHEVIALLSTMDNVTVKPGDRERLCGAFDLYAREHPESSFGEQAEIIRDANLNSGELISWCQTSVCEFQFSPIYNDESGEYEHSDLACAWDLFEQLDGKEAASLEKRQ